MRTIHNAGEAALHDAVRRWAAEIRHRSGWTVETILVAAENLLAAVQDLAPHGPHARNLLAAEAKLSRAMMSRLEAIGRNAATLRLYSANLPPHLSSLHALTRLPCTQFRRAVASDLRGMSCAAIVRRFTPAPPRRPRGGRMIIALPAGMAEETRRKVEAEIAAAVARIAKDHGFTAANFRHRAGRRPAPRPPSSDRHAERL
ncbi:MAG: hypothetical protein AB7S92_21545 [Parvibaculaceae bacterium]